MRSSHLAQCEADRKPFEHYAQLPQLTEAIHKLLTPSHRHGNGCVLLIEPSDIPVCQAWHRDLRETDPGIDPKEFRRVQYDPLFFNQINCPLYEDTCLWYVPGSHLRGDFLAETKAASTSPFAKAAREFTMEEREILGLQYCRAMPGGFCLAMNAGDCAVYHPLAWHLGNYVPYKIRATLHDSCRTAEVDAWYASRSKK
jgi:ectoine hydroxylase-related dioxygenase (phytanoyl-CoA dioxygenase family)